jgi:hypothetical protein
LLVKTLEDYVSVCLPSLDYDLCTNKFLCFEIKDSTAFPERFINVYEVQTIKLGCDLNSYFVYLSEGVLMQLIFLTKKLSIKSLPTLCLVKAYSLVGGFETEKMIFFINFGQY